MDYITIIQGDDTNFLGDQFLVINFNTDIDLSGFTATFTLGDVTLTYGDLSGKNFEVILSDEITSNLKLGKQYGELKLIDTQQRIRTVTSVIPFLVRKGVNEEIRFVNNSLEVSMNINDTVLNVLIETPGIARAEATRMMSYCNDAKVSAQSYANEAHNTHIQLNQDVDAFYGRMANFDDIVADAYQTCVDNITTINETRDNTINEVETLGNEKIAIATQQANIATQKTQEVSNTYNTAMSDIAASRSASLSAIENKKDDSISDIEDKRVSSVDSVEDTAELGRYSLTEIANELLYKWNLFDVVKKDHLLSFSETQGLALPGTYVYKTPVAGERYGYPAFYEKCVEEYNNAEESVITIEETPVTVYKYSNGHIYYDIADKEIFDNLYEKSSIESYYGIDIENERIFLPRKNIRYLVREYHNGNAWYELYSDGWLRQGNVSYAASSSSGYVCQILYPYASNVWNIQVTNSTWAAQWSSEAMLRVVEKTQNTFTLQSGANRSDSYYYWEAEGYTNIPDDLFEYDYICVGNTIQNVSTTNIAETITCDNDTIPLFYSEYSTRDLGINYLKSLGQWNNGNLYSTAYQHLVNLLGNDNSVKEIGDTTITDFDFVINQDDLTFRLPIATNQRFLIDKKIATPEDHNWYNLYSDGWLEQGGSFVSATGSRQTKSLIKSYKNSAYCVYLSSADEADTTPIVANARVRDNSAFYYIHGLSGSTYSETIYWKAEGFVDIVPNDYKLCNLYFKVSNYLQNAQLLDVENVLSVAQNKADIDLSNVIRLSKTFSKLIMTDVMPDWSAVTTLPLGTNNTISRKGWIIMRNTVYNSMLDGYINGRYIYHQYGSYGHWEEYNTLAIMVDVNDVVYLSGGELLFLPCKGVTNA